MRTFSLLLLLLLLFFVFLFSLDLIGTEALLPTGSRRHSLGGSPEEVSYV